MHNFEGWWGLTLFFDKVIVWIFGIYELEIWAWAITLRVISTNLLIILTSLCINLTCLCIILTTLHVKSSSIDGHEQIVSCRTMFWLFGWVSLLWFWLLCVQRFFGFWDFLIPFYQLLLVETKKTTNLTSYQFNTFTQAFASDEVGINKEKREESEKFFIHPRQWHQKMLRFT